MDGALRSTLLPLREGNYGLIETVGPGKILLKNSWMLAGRLMSCRCDRNNGCRIPGVGLPARSRICDPIANMRLVQCGSGTLVTNAMARRRFDWLNPCSPPRESWFGHPLSSASKCCHLTTAEQPDGAGGWIWKGPADSAKVLYRLTEVL